MGREAGHPTPRLSGMAGICERLAGQPTQVLRLAGKIALITGGGTGMVRACAVLFAKEGACMTGAAITLDGELSVC